MQPIDVSLTSMTPLSSVTDTPNGGGYTSEDTDYSVSTPSDEQMYQDMSFLQSADTSELVEVVADFCSTEDLTALTPQQQQKFAGKVIKGKVRIVCRVVRYMYVLIDVGTVFNLCLNVCLFT